MKTKMFKVTHRLSNTSSLNLGSDKNENLFLELVSSVSTIYLQSTLSTSKQFSRIAVHICELRRTDMQAMLNDLQNLPPAALLNYRLGYLFRRAGSAVYVYQAKPIRVKLRATDECYEEIPISLLSNGEEVEAFATSKARLIILNGTKLDCGAGRPVHFFPFSQEDEHPVRVSERGTNTSALFSDMDLITPSNVPGRWLCQSNHGFHECSVPSTLTPTQFDISFAQIEDKYLRSSIFGTEGRKALFSAQTESYGRNIMISRIKNIIDGKTQASANDMFLKNMDRDARKQLQRLVLPAFFWFFGDFMAYLEQIVLIIWLTSIILNLLALIGRLRHIFFQHGCSRHMFLAVFGKIYSSFIPWYEISTAQEKQVQAQKAEIERLEDIIMNLSQRLDTFMLNSPRLRPNPMYPCYPQL